ncbi:hypothetical protein F5Y17DRAFT_385619 [Xylariaceae sp. FL0594]|nr:hypothetical protein F5Y17DRAFT_385619 [Xylariaceae sp. FL0594]
MANLPITNPTIPPGSLILVTGANGLIASWAVDKLLEAGYRVRGTVRSTSRCAWMIPFFENRHGRKDCFEMVQVSDFTAPGAWDAPVRDVAGIAAVAGITGLDIEDVDAALALEQEFVFGLLETAAKEGSAVRSFVFTSSAWAAFTPDPTREKETTRLDEWSYNEDAVRLLREEGVGVGGGGGLASYMALKTLLEQSVWDWVREHEPSYAFNTILPETVLGEMLSPKDQGITSTCGFVKWLRDGVNLDMVRGVRPQRFVDTKDLGWLYVAALVTPGVDRERIWAFGERFSFKRVGEILQDLEPQRKIPVLPDDGWDRVEVPNQRAEALLRRVTGHGWAKLEDSISDCLKSILKAGA